jgi:hypothetical protein
LLALAASANDGQGGGNLAMTGGTPSDYAAKGIAIPGNWLCITRNASGPNTDTACFVGVSAQSCTIQFTTSFFTRAWSLLDTASLSVPIES